jgi:hypothetical protein
MKSTIAAAGNTIVPAILALEDSGFEVHVVEGSRCRITRGDETYLADDPVTALGLVKLIELRGWNWCATDAQIESTLSRHGLA